MISQESNLQPTPRATLEAVLEGEPVGSPKWQRVADVFAFARASAQINLLSRNPQSVEMQKAVAEWALIKETIRTRSMGPDAVAYSQAATAINEVHASYWDTYKVPDPAREGYFLLQETDWVMGEAILADLQSMVDDRASAH